MGTDRQTWSSPSLSFTFYLMLAILLTTVPIICMTSFVDYAGVRQELDKDTTLLQDQTEKSIVLSMDLVDTGLRLFDDTLNHQMREGFSPFLAEYERAGRDPAAMNLSHVKEQLGGTMDLYIISESGVVEHTTYPPDQGLDFSTIPGFYDRITEIRLGDDFAADRVVAELSTGQLRKYAYMPTPDHRYLLELGLAESEFKGSRKALKYKTTVADLISLNPNVMHLRIFDWQGTQITKEAFPDDDLRQSIIRETYLNKTTHEIGNASAGEKTRYLFIDMADPDYASDMSLIAELTYSTTAAKTELADLLARHSINLLIAIACIMLLSVGAAHTLTKPIRMLVRDVDAIARGDLDHRICVAGGEEFVRLEQSITAMVTTMKETIQKLRESEEGITRYSHVLEEEVRERTIDLQESNRIANLYLDIMTHDINNANNAANLYADLLLEELGGKQEEYASKAKMGLQKSIETINNVNTIRQIQEREPHLKEVDLDQVIRKEVVRFTGSPITYTNTGATVLADDLISEVFVNLIGNAAKFGGPEVEVAIRVEEHGDEVCVSVEDTGPGVVDELKGRIFDRFARGTHRTFGTGLGLYICRMLVERYGGRIWEEDRVPGHPEQGASFKFTLRKWFSEGG
jgi:two-component system, NarL family, sensor histidine kinase BarA